MHRRYARAADVVKRVGLRSDPVENEFLQRDPVGPLGDALHDQAGDVGIRRYVLVRRSLRAACLHGFQRVECRGNRFPDRRRQVQRFLESINTGIDVLVAVTVPAVDPRGHIDDIANRDPFPGRARKLRQVTLDRLLDVDELPGFENGERRGRKNLADRPGVVAVIGRHIRVRLVNDGAVVKHDHAVDQGARSDVVVEPDTIAVRRELGVRDLSAELFG